VPLWGRRSRPRDDEGGKTAGLREPNRTATALLEDRWRALCTVYGVFAIEIAFYGRNFHQEYANNIDAIRRMKIVFSLAGSPMSSLKRRMDTAESGWCWPLKGA
jgi:hypothetical protein